jgi:hypothetical protein
MNKLRCPALDSLGRKMIEAFRRVEEVSVMGPNSEEIGFAAKKLAAVKREISEHRLVCFLCTHTLKRAS